MAETTPDDNREQVLSYIRETKSQGVDAILDAIKQGHQQLMAGIEGLSLEQAGFKPPPDEWSALETMTHIIEVKRGVTKICQALARGEQPEPVSSDVREVQFRDGFSIELFASPQEAVEAAVAAHENLVAFVTGLSDASNTEETHVHPFFGPLNCREWAVFQRVHDGDHAGQIEQIVAAAGYPA